MYIKIGIFDYFCFLKKVKGRVHYTLPKHSYSFFIKKPTRIFNRKESVYQLFLMGLLKLGTLTPFLAITIYQTTKIFIRPIPPLNLYVNYDS